MEFANAANVYLSHYEGAFTDSNEIDLFRDRVDEKWKQPLLELAKKTGAQDLIDVVSSIDPLDKQSWQRVINGLYKDHEDEYNLYSAGKLLQSAALQTYTAAYLASPEFAASVAGANGLAVGKGGILDSAAFAQKTYNPQFSAGGKFAGQSVDDVAAALRSGTLKPGDLPIDFIVRDGNTLMLNTRSAQALEAAGVPRSAWNAVNRTGQDFYENLLTGQLQRNNLTSTGIDAVRRSGGL
jgi:hypothetical protein